MYESNKDSWSVEDLMQHLTFKVYTALSFMYLDTLPECAAVLLHVGELQPSDYATVHFVASKQYNLVLKF